MLLSLVYVNSIWHVTKPISHWDNPDLLYSARSSHVAHNGCICEAEPNRANLPFIQLLFPSVWAKYMNSTFSASERAAMKDGRIQQYQHFLRRWALVFHTTLSCLNHCSQQSQDMLCSYYTFDSFLLWGEYSFVIFFAECWELCIGKSVVWHRVFF